MFEFKHKIELQNAETVFLSGPDYYCDKPNFWRHHQTQLTVLYQSVMVTGFPIQITDLEDNFSITIHSKSEFQEWLKVNQPFNVEE